MIKSFMKVQKFSRSITNTQCVKFSLNKQLKANFAELKFKNSILGKIKLNVNKDADGPKTKDTTNQNIDSRKQNDIVTEPQTQSEGPGPKSPKISLKSIKLKESMSTKKIEAQKSAFDRH